MSLKLPISFGIEIGRFNKSAVNIIEKSFFCVLFQIINFITHVFVPAPILCSGCSNCFPF